MNSAQASKIRVHRKIVTDLITNALQVARSDITILEAQIAKLKESK